MKRKAIVKEIQVGGYNCHKSLYESCKDYVDSMEKSNCLMRPKMIFVIELPNGDIKQITIRDEETQAVAYGDFDGLPDFLEYSKIIDEERKS